MIMAGIQIGNGAVIAAGSVVTTNVGAYEIVGGNPAQVIKKRFSDDRIQSLERIQWWNWSVNKIKENYSLINSENVDDFIFKFK
jgi:serine acetyltransferase